MKGSGVRRALDLLRDSSQQVQWGAGALAGVDEQHCGADIHGQDRQSVVLCGLAIGIALSESRRPLHHRASAAANAAGVRSADARSGREINECC